MKIINISVITEEAMSPILYGVVYKDSKFYNFRKKVSREFIHDLRAVSKSMSQLFTPSVLFNNVDLEDIILNSDLTEKLTNEEILDLYYLSITMQNNYDNSIKDILKSWYIRNNRNNKLYTLGI